VQWHSSEGIFLGTSKNPPSLEDVRDNWSKVTDSSAGALVQGSLQATGDILVKLSRGNEEDDNKNGEDHLKDTVNSKLPVYNLVLAIIV